MTENQEISNLQMIAVDYVNSMDNLGKTFKVETKRSDKKYPITSREVSSLVGGYILEKVSGITVDVSQYRKNGGKIHTRGIPGT